ncbi:MULTISPECIES: TIGR04255 family protein [Arthrobacter]|nr:MULTISPECIES: TIGR04255 family protein [Arthrobacter]MBT8163287.1 TIGR04255 family protein [Arthrobacter sp. GN70]
MTSDQMATPGVSFAKPPVAEVAIGVQFAPVSGLSTFRASRLLDKWKSKYPVVSEQPPMPPWPLPNDGSGGFMVQFGGLPGNRIWLESNDRQFLVQLQNDRLVVNWRTLDGFEYPRYPAIRARFVEAWDDLRQLMSVEGESVSAQLIDVSYINAMPGVTPSQAIAGWTNPLSNQEAGAVNANFSEPIKITGGSAAVRVTSLNGQYNGEQGVSLTLTVRAVPVLDPLEAIDQSRRHIIERFRAVTDDEMHARWEVES